MKQTARNGTAAILRRIETIEKEVVNLKLSVLKKLTPSVKKIYCKSSLRALRNGEGKGGISPHWSKAELENPAIIARTFPDLAKA